MTQYRWSFVGSVVIFLLINLGCNSKNEKSMSNSYFDPELHEQSNLQKDFSRGYTMMPTAAPAGGNSDFFHIRYLNKNRQIKYINSVEEVSITISNKNKNDKELLLPITIVPNSNPVLFNFRVPADFAFENYNLKLYYKNFPGANQQEVIEVVENKELDFSEVRIMKVRALQGDNLNGNFLIPRGECISVHVSALQNSISYDITHYNKNLYTPLFLNSETLFTFNLEEMAICAFRIKSGVKCYPKVAEKDTFVLEHEHGLKSAGVTIRAVEGRVGDEEEQNPACSISEAL